jgi:hypothetical protein
MISSQESICICILWDESIFISREAEPFSLLSHILKPFIIITRERGREDERGRKEAQIHFMNLLSYIIHLQSGERRKNEIFMKWRKELTYFRLGN